MLSVFKKYSPIFFQCYISSRGKAGARRLASSHFDNMQRSVQRSTTIPQFLIRIRTLASDHGAGHVPDASEAKTRICSTDDVGILKDITVS